MEIIPLVNLHRQHERLRDQIGDAVNKVVSRGDFILGADVEAFEREFAAFCGAKHCVGVASGLDALVLALRGVGVGPGHEVITAANSFIATALAILHAGATPVLIDHDPGTYTLDPRRILAAITPRTKAIVPVHLYGHPAEMDAINTMAAEHGLEVIEDAAQAHGARYRGARCGTLARAAAFSFYPGKNLGALGDGGGLVTDDDELAGWARTARNYGSSQKYHHTVRGWNSRLDTIQAAVLRVKMRHLDAWNQRRRDLAERYVERLKGLDLILPNAVDHVEHVYHLFVVRTSQRDALLAHLHTRGISAAIHYPIPIHHQVAMKGACLVPRPLPHADSMCAELLSLPMCPELTFVEQDRVVEAIEGFASTTDTRTIHTVR